MRFQTKQELLQYIESMLIGLDIFYERENGRQVDLLTVDAVIEVYLVLNCDVLYAAIAQGKTARIHWNKSRLLVMGQAPFDYQEHQRAKAIAQELMRQPGVEIVFIEGDVVPVGNRKRSVRSSTSRKRLQPFVYSDWWIDHVGVVLGIFAVVTCWMFWVWK